MAISWNAPLFFVCALVSPLRESTPGETGCLDAQHGSRVRYDEWKYTRNASPCWLKCQLAEMVGAVEQDGRQGNELGFPWDRGCKIPGIPGLPHGFDERPYQTGDDAGGTGTVLDRVPQIARKGEYELAIVEQNVLGKPTRLDAAKNGPKIIRSRTCAGPRLLRVPLGSGSTLSVDPAGRPMLAFLGIE